MHSTTHNEAKELFIKKNIPEKHLLRKALPADASLRTYERISFNNRSLLLMDSSQELQSVPPFIKAQKFLALHGFSVPKILAEDIENGFLLIEDFGTDTYTNILSHTHSTRLEKDLYKKSVDVLISLHKKPLDSSFRKYDKSLLIDEALILADWHYIAAHGKSIPESLRKEYIEIWDKILSNIKYKAQCFVLRDYHIDNMMILNNRKGIAEVGLLDFQDAVIGSYAYDLVSLLEDARRDIPKVIAAEMQNYYLKHIDMINKKDFLTDYNILGVQRSCKIVGIFSRKAIRDKNDNYLIHLPRVWGYIKRGLETPIMNELETWLLKNKLIP